MPYTIRQATPVDASAINRLCVEAYAEFESVVGQDNWRQMREALASAADLSTLGELLVAEDANGVIGVVLYIPPGKSDGRSIPQAWATIRMLAVSPASRGSGVGRKLTEECINRARRDGAEAIGLTTADMMKVAEPMYERMGFQKEAALGTRFGVRHARYKLPLNEAS
ncbi:MAG: GNAT family N-acetyltransferase [Blastocatellia bacterium]